MDLGGFVHTTATARSGEQEQVVGGSLQSAPRRGPESWSNSVVWRKQRRQSSKTLSAGLLGLSGFSRTGSRSFNTIPSSADSLPVMVRWSSSKIFGVDGTRDWEFDTFLECAAEPDQ